jgi:PAS domain S-box-containing protein
MVFEDRHELGRDRLVADRVEASLIDVGQRYVRLAPGAEQPVQQPLCEPDIGVDLRQLAERLVSGMPDAIVYADAQGVIRFWNRGATRIFGFAEAEALGQPLDIIIPERLRARHWEGFGTTMRTGQSRYGEGQMLSVPAIRKDGTQISVEFTIVPFTGESGGMIGIAAIIRDATARFEELRALRRQIADLASKPES